MMSLKMKKLLWLFFLFGFPVASASAAEEAWTHMPAGARPAYMGIHGGTVPVSLLVSSDGNSLFTFVGQTGNDFMEALRRVRKPLPTLGNSTRLSAAPAKAATGLFAGNATESVPVFTLPAEAYSGSGLSQHLQPFGLSDEPSSIEGDVARPRVFQLARPFRLFRLPDYFQPRRSQNIK